MSGEVVLVPGLWMPAAVMLPLARRLAAAGYAVHRFGYRGRDAPEANLARLARFVRETCSGAAHFVGHSLGGVLVFDLLAREPALPAGRVVLIGAPVRGSLAGRRLGSAGVGRWMLGGCRARWPESEARWPRPEALGVIAGTAPGLGFGRVLGRLPGDNDGVVCVAETAAEGMVERLLVPQSHSMLAISPRVGKMVERFLQSGTFS